MSYVLVPLVVFMVGAAYANVAIPSIPYWAWVLIIGGVTTIVNYFGVEIAAKANLYLSGINGCYCSNICIYLR